MTKLILFIVLMLVPTTAFSLRVVQTSLLNNTAMAVAENDSYGINVCQMNNISIQTEWTGTPTGTLKLQYSDDIVSSCPAPNVACHVSTWSDYSGSQAPIAGVAGNQAWNVTLAGYCWIRMVYVGTGSTGTFTKINITAKGY